MALVSGLFGSMSDMDTRTMTPDRINVESLLQNEDYMNATQSDLATTTEVKVTAGTSLDFSTNFRRGLVGQSADLSSRITYTAGTETEISLPPGLADSAELSERNETRSHFLLGKATLDSEESEQHSSPVRRSGPKSSGPLQVSVTIPSMGEEDSGSEEYQETLSEISLHE